MSTGSRGHWARARLGAAADDGGFTLVEALIVGVIVGLVAAVARTVFFGYARDAKSAEAKALAGSVLGRAQRGAVRSSLL